MMRPPAPRRAHAALLLAHFTLLAACGGSPAYRQASEMLKQGRAEEALAPLERAMREQPNNREYRVRYLNTQAKVIGDLLGEAAYQRGLGHLDEAEALYRRVIALDAANAPALAGLASVDQERELARRVMEARFQIAAGDLDAADQALLKVLQVNPRHSEALALRRQIEERTRYSDVVSPRLKQSLQKPVSLQFRDTGLKQVMEALSKHAGLNFVLDKDVPATINVTLSLRQVSVDDALDIILGTNQLRRRVLNDTTVLIYPDVANKVGDHQDLVVKNFFLANAEAKQVANMLKTVLKAKNVFADDKLNLLIVRDTPAMIRLVERMVAIQDVGEPEVMLELEVLEIQRSRLLNLGVKFPDQLTLAPLPINGTALTLYDITHARPPTIGATISAAQLNLQRTVSDTNLLANPRIRTHNREKAVIRIGDRVPVITTTATSTGFVSENVQYVDVGLKLEVEPIIFPTDEVALKLNLEVSSVTREVVSRSGTVSYQIGGRNAATVLRLKDGETQVLGGLINDQDVRSANRFPGLGDLPMLGRLFSSQRNANDKTELILSVTPRIVRNLAPPAQVPAEFWSGTENDPRLNLIALARAGGGPLPVGTPDAAPARPALAWEAPGVVKAGDTFHLRLNLRSPVPLTSLPLRIAYDRNVLEPVRVLPGTFLAQGNSVVEQREQIDADNGILYLSQARSGGQGASGAGSLVDIEFRAKRAAPGSAVSVLATEAVTADPAGKLPLGAAAVTVTVAP